MAGPLPPLHAVLAAALVVLAACRGDAAKPAAAPPLVLIVSLDTFRADLLDDRRADGAPETPNLLAFADRALRFDDCFAPIAFTLPSHMTLLTGLHPLTHDVTDESRALSPAVTTLAEALRDSGFRTEAVVNSRWLRAGTGFERGFDAYRQVDETLGSSSRVTDLALAAVDRADTAGARLFLFVHYFEAHSDSAHLGSLMTYYSPPGDHEDLELADEDFCAPDGRCATKYLLAADRGQVPFSDAQVRLHHELYRRGARFLDRHIGRLLRGLEERRRLDPALIVLTSDHGEEFREHGRLLHKQLWTENLRVPLLIKLPEGERAGERVPDLAELSDVAPTVLARAGVAPPAGLQGRDLLAARERPDPEILALDRADPSRASLRSAEWLLVFSRKAATTQLFDRGADPGEQLDLSGARPEAADRLRRRLAAAFRRLEADRPAPGAGEAPQLDEQTRERLRSLGYL